MSHDGCVALPRGAMGLSSVCDSGFPDHTHLLNGLHGVTWKALCRGMNILPIILVEHDCGTVTTLKHSKICKLTLVCIDRSGVK